MDLNIQKEACVCARMYNIGICIRVSTCVHVGVFACLDACACVCMNGASTLHPEDQDPWSAALMLCEGPGSSETCTVPRGSKVPG